MNLIDKKNDGELNRNEIVVAKKRLDITLRFFLSVSVILLIINNFFVTLDTSIVLYILISATLTVLLILNEKKETGTKRGHWKTKKINFS